MNHYTIQRVRHVTETVMEYITIDDLKLREICDELGIDIDKLVGNTVDNLLEFEDLWDSANSWEGIDILDSEADEDYSRRGVNAGKRFAIDGKYYDTDTGEEIQMNR